MIGIVIASHGEFCVGLKGTTEMFTGEIENCEVAPLRPGVSAEEYDGILEAAIDKVDDGSGVIVLTDLKGGTPYNRSAGMVFKGKNIKVATGMNLPMLMSIVFDDRSNGKIDEIFDNALNEAGNGIDQIAIG